MDRVVILLVVVVACLLGAGCRCDPVKVTTDDLPLQTSKNEGLSQQTVDPKNDGDNKGSLEAFQGEIKKNPGKKNDMPLAEGESKPVKETIPKQEKSNDGDASKTMPKENSHGDVCDASSSKSCKDDNNKLIACLRVPGNDSPTLSLLVQNKGASSLNINISASEFVKSEKSTVSLLPGKDEKVKISFEDGIENGSISLVTGNWHCDLSLLDMIPDPIKKNVPSPDPAYSNSSRSISMIYPPLMLILIIGVAYVVIRLRRRRLLEETSSYEKLDMVLPVSTGGVKETDVAEGWDDSWGDNWDDEEAPMTPSTPSFNLSSKRLASRSINKDGWKD